MDMITHDELVRRVQTALQDAETACPDSWSRVALATEGRDGPDLRYVLLKGFDARGFVFFTNYESVKARQLSHSPRASLAFHWWETGVQLRVRGLASKVSPEESDAYFASRDRMSQLGAWASRQSHAVLEPLEQRIEGASERFPGEVPRPANWGGFRVRPTGIELWFDRDARLHERFVYKRIQDQWRGQRLDP
ncbi:MAG: pyridoxamine 5'-phosphate oxidase [Polyangiales bacterium]|jgi:pyridoxamine 5'-phosphate oxidase